MKPRLFLEDEIIKETCLMGRHDKCCRYLVAGPNGFECAKLNPTLKWQIDQRAKRFIAKGDNCEGIEMLIGHKISRN